ncbi:MAG: FAD-dependent oxidoreductase [Catalinimonas sp.]
MLSLWESTSWTRFDYVVVGGGITGLSAAVALKEAEPTADVAVLERGSLPTGASTRNAGFACFGSLTELVDDLRVLGPEAVYGLVERRYRGLQRLRRRFGDEAIGWEGRGGWELLGRREAPALTHLTEVNRALRPLFDADVFRLRDEALAGFGFSRHHVHHLLHNPFEGQVDTGRLTRALVEDAARRGVLMLGGARVEHLADEKGAVELNVQLAGQTEAVRFRAGKLVVCTNAFTKLLLPDVDLRPGRGQVLVTDPIPNLPLRGTFHFDRGYYYFRNVADRVLLGGGRHLDLIREQTTRPALNWSIQHHLEELLERVVLPGRHFKVAQRWAGIMAFGRDKRPLLRRVSDRVVVGVRLGGMGVALGGLLGEAAAGMLLGHDSRDPFGTDWSGPINTTAPSAS